jgi:hypothetical protein
METTLQAACPPPTESDPTPGLSYGARTIILERPRGRICRPPWMEVSGLENLLATMSNDDLDRARLLSRLAELHFQLERQLPAECHATRTYERMSARAFLELEREVAKLVVLLRLHRQRALSRCRQLRVVDPTASTPSRCAPAQSVRL